MIDTASKLIEALELPEDRPLEPIELERVVAAVAARRDVWAPRLGPVDGTRAYAALHRDATVDVWAIAWLAGGDTGWHDHDVSSGAVHVVEGALEELELSLAGADRRRRPGAGSSFSFGPSHIHRLTCPEGRALSIHAYSPPLWRLGQYTVGEDGALRRVSVSYADELRPLEAAVA